mgnify:CR=1 FL=1
MSNPMKTVFAKTGRVLMTLAVVAVAFQIGHGLWDYYTVAPWTRDAHVRADVVAIAADVSGPVSEVLVRDNASVKQGDVLFRIDARRFQLAERQADAAMAGASAALNEAKRELSRYRRLGKAISRQAVDQARTELEKANAAYLKAQADRDLARLNLERAQVVAPVNGTVTNLNLQPGDYVSASQPVLALLDTDTLRVEGYFEETKLGKIHIGDPVDIHLMGQGTLLHGRVESVTAAIEDRERSTGSGLLANINPTFTWVRLAQRVPVRIALEDVPEDVRLVAGLTATVSVRPDHAEKG